MVSFPRDEHHWDAGNSLALKGRSELSPGRPPEIGDPEWDRGSGGALGTPRFLLRFLGRGFVVFLLLLLFLFRQLLLLVLVLVFLATLISHTCSFFSDCDLKVWITTRLIIRNRPN
jgi:hypothetical protein